MFKPPTGTFWRQIINLDNINFCQLLNGTNNNVLPVVAYYRDFLLNLLPFLPKKCPIAQGKFYGYNLSIENDDGSKALTFISPASFPNGIYLNIFKLSTQSDPQVVTVWFRVESYDPKNAENIMR